MNTKTTSLERTNILRFINNVGKRNHFNITLEKQVFNKNYPLFSKTLMITINKSLESMV